MRVKRRKDVLNHSQAELKALANDVNAHVFIKTRKFHVSFHPSCLRDIKNAVLDYLDSVIRTYDEKLNGLILGYRSVTILKDVGAIFNDDSYIHLDFEAEFYVFAPAVGSVLTGIVSKNSPEYVGCLVHRVFNIAIPRPLDCKREDWSGSSVTVGQEITFTVDHVDLEARLPYIRGILLDTGPSVQQTGISGQDSVGLIGDSVPVEDNVLVEEEHKKRKRETGDEEESAFEQKKKRRKERNPSEDRSEEKNDQLCDTGIEESEEYSFMEYEPNESQEMNITSGATKKTKNKRVSFQEYTVVNDHSFYEVLSGPNNLDTSKCESISPEQKKKKKKKKTELEASYESEISETFADETINSLSSPKSKKKRRSSENGNSLAVETDVTGNKDESVSAVPEMITRNSGNEESEMVYHKKKKKKKKTDVEQSSVPSPEVSATDNLLFFEEESSSSPKKKKKKKKRHDDEHSYNDESHIDTSEIEILENESEYLTSWPEVGVEMEDSLKSKLTETDTGQMKTGEEDNIIGQDPHLNEPSGDAWEVPPKKKKKKKDKQDEHSSACKSHFNSSSLNVEGNKDNNTNFLSLALPSDISLPDIPMHTTVEKRKKKSKRKEHSLNEIHAEPLTLNSSKKQKKNLNDNAEEDAVEINSVETQLQSVASLSSPTKKKKKKKNEKKDTNEDASDSVLHNNLQEIPDLHNPTGISCDTEKRKERKNKKSEKLPDENAICDTEKKKDRKNKISEKLPDENAVKERYDKIVHELMLKIHMEGSELSHTESRENEVIPVQNNPLNEVGNSQDQDIFSGMDSEFFTSTQVEDGLKSRTEHTPSSEKKKKRKSKDKISNLHPISAESCSSKSSNLPTVDNRKEEMNEEAEDLRNSIMSSILSVLGSPKPRTQSEHSEDGRKKSKKKKKEKEISTHKEKKKLTDTSFPKGESPKKQLVPNEVQVDLPEGNQSPDSGTHESSLPESLDMKVVETPMGTFNIPDISNITLSRLSDIMHRQNLQKPEKKSKKKLSDIDDDIPSNDQRKNSLTSSVDIATKSPKSKQMSLQEISAQSKVDLNSSTTAMVKSLKLNKSSSVKPLSSGTIAEQKQKNASSGSSDSETDTSGDEEGVQEISAQSKVDLNSSTTAMVKSLKLKGKTLENKSNVKSSSVKPLSSGTIAEQKQKNASSGSSDSETDTSGDEEGVKPSVVNSSSVQSNSREEIGSAAKGSLFLDGGVDKKQRHGSDSSDRSSKEMLSGAKSNRSKIKGTAKSNKTVSSSNLAKPSSKLASVQSQPQLAPSDIVPLSHNPEIRRKSVNNNTSVFSPVSKKGVSSNGSPITNVPVYSNFQTSTPSNVLFSPSEASNSPGPDLSRILEALKSPSSSIRQELQKNSENSPLSRLSSNAVSDNLNAETRKLLSADSSHSFLSPSSSTSPEHKKKHKKKKSHKSDSVKKDKKKKEKTHSLDKVTSDLNTLTSDLIAKYLKNVS